jgi:hypothetical protein
MVLMVFEFQVHVFWIVVLCLCSDQSEVVGVFLFLICGLVQVLFLSLVVDFKFFYNHFPITAFGLDLFWGAYLNKFTVSMVPDDWELNLRGPTH